MKLYKQLEAVWTKYLLGPDWSPFVFLVDMLYSQCHYCLFWRGAILGVAIALLLSGHLIGAFLFVALLVALTWAERKYG